MATANLSQLRAGAQTSDPFQELLARPVASFDPDAYHAMQARDDTLIRDELLHGSTSDAFVYSFEMSGKKVVGVSVIGARELAAQYKGIKTRIVATIEKTGALFIFRTFTPLSIQVQHIPELADDSDFYECVMEVADIKTGNSIEVRKKESKIEKKRNGEGYARPHYDVICESKAYRNGVLAVLPQSVIRDFRDKCLATGKSSNEQTIQQRRAGVSTYAARSGMALDRAVLDGLSFSELDGLAGAAREGLEVFKRAAAAMKLTGDGIDQATGEVPPPPPAIQKAQPKAAAPAPAALDAGAISARIAAAKDFPTLNAVGAELQQVADDQVRSELEEEFMDRQAQLEEALRAAQEQAQAPAAATPPASRRSARAPSPASME
jgi:hypothetical protein